VYASAVLTGISIVFATVVLIGEDSKELSLYTLTFMVHPLLLYFVFTSLLTVAVLLLKFYLYSAKEEVSEDYPFEDAQKPRGSRRRWSLLVLLLTVAVLFLPLILSVFVEPLWSFISISGFVPAVAFPEIILYIYSRYNTR